MQFKKLLFIAILLVMGLTVMNAQQVVPASGGNASGSGGTVTYTVGQLFYNTYNGTNGSVSEGVQQPFEISVVTGIKEANGITLISSVYPNPATEVLTLRIALNETMDLAYKLFDLNGKLLEEYLITENETLIKMGRFSPGVYLLKITDKSNDVKTFKIIKN